MTGRERVLRALEFRRPDRVPRELTLVPCAEVEHGTQALAAIVNRWPNDIVWPDVVRPELEALREGRQDGHEPTYRDEWGCVFERLQQGVMGEVIDPILADWSRLEDLRVPDKTLAVDANEVRRACAAVDGFAMGRCCPRPFERIQFLRGSENTYLDLAQRTGDFFTLLAKVHDFYCRETEVWARTDVDGIVFMDDWGSQTGLLISPELWREVFKPLYADYVRIAHDHGKKAFMHSDGWIFELYGDLIEIGVDTINSQLFCMDIEEIGARFAGRITFWGEIDRQEILARGTVDQARAAVDRVVQNLYRPEGGVIAELELGPGAKLENVDAVFQRWEELTGGE